MSNFITIHSYTFMNNKFMIRDYKMMDIQREVLLF